MTSARVVWALASAEPLGLLTDPKVLDKAAAYLLREFAKVERRRPRDPRRVLLHALSTRGKATFEQANSLNRLRQGLSDAALAYLALTFVEPRPRPSWRARCSTSSARGARPSRRSPASGPGATGPGPSSAPANRGPAETTALAALAFARVRPQAPELAGAIDWLLAHRQGNGWQPHKAKGPALAALAAYYGQAGGAEDRYRLVVTVNDAEVLTLDVAGAAEGKAVLVPDEALKAGDTNRVRFDDRGPGHVRLRRHPDRVHPRLRPRPGPGQPHRADRPPGLPRRPSPSSTARPCRPASASRSTPPGSRTR